MGKLKSQIKADSRQEEQFNRKYQEELVRNILGNYEAGTLEIRHQIYSQGLADAERNKTEKQKKREAGKEIIRSRERQLEDRRGTLTEKKAEIQRQREVYEQYKRELEERKAVLKYLELEEGYLLDRDRILSSSQRKLKELEEMRRSLEKEEDILTKEYQRLTSGKVLELPEELEKELENLDIHAVYGMEWLKKNGYSQKKNQELIHKNPFLPYALILSRQEVEKLGRSDKNICTSFPVPIVEREKIEEIQKKCTDRMVRFSGISFYILFNESLLDEEKLQTMIWGKKQELEKMAQAIKTRKTEYEEYFQRQEMIKNQAVTRENWKEIQVQLKELGEEQIEKEKKIQEMVQNLNQMKKEQEELLASITNASMEIQYQKQRMEDFEQLRKDYVLYENDRAALEKCKKEENRYQENQKRAKERQIKLLEEKRSAENSLNMLEREEEKLNEKYSRYAAYETTTSVLSQELQELEEREKKTAVRFQREKEELEHLQKKYRLTPEQWNRIIYDRKE